MTSCFIQMTSNWHSNDTKLMLKLYQAVILMTSCFIQMTSNWHSNDTKLMLKLYQAAIQTTSSCHTNDIKLPYKLHLNDVKLTFIVLSAFDFLHLGLSCRWRELSCCSRHPSSCIGKRNWTTSSGTWSRRCSSARSSQPLKCHPEPDGSSC